MSKKTTTIDYNFRVRFLIDDDFSPLTLRFLNDGFFNGNNPFHLKNRTVSDFQRFKRDMQDLGFELYEIEKITTQTQKS
jgi:hypothetical protein